LQRPDSLARTNNNYLARRHDCRHPEAGATGISGSTWRAVWVYRWIFRRRGTGLRLADSYQQPLWHLRRLPHRANRLSDRNRLRLGDVASGEGMSRSDQKQSWRSRLGWLAGQLFVIFLGVSAAFVVENYRETLNQREELRQAVNHLPPDQRQTILMTYFGGLSHRELAEKLNLPVSTIKGRARLGLQRLRQLLPEQS